MNKIKAKKDKIKANNQRKKEIKKSFSFDTFLNVVHKLNTNLDEVCPVEGKVISKKNLIDLIVEYHDNDEYTPNHAVKVAQ